MKLKFLLYTSIPCLKSTLSRFIPSLALPILGLSVLAPVSASTPSSVPERIRADVAARLDAMPGTHPRIFLDREAEAALKRRIAEQPLLQSVQADLEDVAERMLDHAPVQRELIGRRLLRQSRTALSRVLHLGLVWRLTGKSAYLERARAELVAVANFSDWNPSHFLDVAEMTLAVAVGYDWFHAELDDGTRALLRTAIIEKGLKPSFAPGQWWVRSGNNWNQVCNAGMTIGALAVAEDEPSLATDVIARAVNTVPLAMNEYAPDGTYPEGPMYWGYGTTFNVILISALETALGSDFGLAAMPGFLATADYYLHVIGPSGYSFNYFDAPRSRDTPQPAMFWFAARLGRADLLHNQLPVLERRLADRSNRRTERTDPLLLLWMASRPGQPAQPLARAWSGGGKNPVAFHRGGWDRDASYVAIKGGSPSLPHGHMDVGSFIMEAAGVRWADDLGAQGYHSLESQGIRLWDSNQDAPRWTVFRLGASSHNVLQVEGQPQRVDGHAPIVLSRSNRTIVDTTDVYAGQLASARRGVTLLADGSARIQDEFATLDRGSRVRWAMVTRADVRIEGPGRATLIQDGKNLVFRILSPSDAMPVVYPTDPPPSPIDAPNPGTRMIGFEIAAPANHSGRLVVELIPGDAPSAPARITPLAEW